MTDHLRMLERHPEMAAYMAVTPDAAYVDISEAMEWYWSESDQVQWDIHDDLYRLTAPAKVTWLEYGPPSRINEGGVLKPWPLEIQRIGARVVCLRIPEGDRERAVAHDALEKFYCQAVMEKSYGEVMRELIKRDPYYQDARAYNVAAGIRPAFCLGMETFVQVNNRLGLSTWWAAYLDEDGRAYDAKIARATILMLSPALVAAYNRGELTDQEMQDASSGSTTPFCFALSLMNCRNVERVADPRRMQRHEQRRMKRDGAPDVRYEWLRIKQLQRQAEADGKASAGGHAKKRLHQVRAHWATYSPDAPLFGKYDGTYFRPQHVRGLAEVGKVVKGYDLLHGGGK